jgi:prolyl-tRNA synthetase
MRLSTSFSTTLRVLSSEAETPGHQLLLRAGFIRQLGQGLFSYLPFGRRAVANIQRILREEMNRIGGQEIRMPVIQPAELWKRTGRYDSIGPELARFKDRRGRDLVLGMTNEEVVALLAASEVHTYRQLPRLVYQIQTKFRDDPRPRAGLIRMREFLMKDSYSLDLDEDGLEQQYATHYQAYLRIFERCELPVIVVGSDVGMMGGSGAHEFMYLNPVGEDTLVLCDSCGYSANRQVAVFRKMPGPFEDLADVTEVSTPESFTVEAVARYLRIPESKVAKAVLLSAHIEGREEVVVAIVRGDMELNETKIVNALGAVSVRPLTEDEISAAGMVPGYASPVGIKGVSVVVDDIIPDSTNLVAGANKHSYHLINVNYGRDFEADVVTDIAAASGEQHCANCGYGLRTERGVEVGNIFKLGTKYSKALGAEFTDATGELRPVVMGSYGIGLDRLLACIAEEHHDDRGLTWPSGIAPFQVHLVSLGEEENIKSQAENLYDLISQKMDVLYEDRDVSAGIKFADADLIGVPIRLIVSKRSLESGGVEVKPRQSHESSIVGVGEVMGQLGAPTDTGMG